jgi:UMF1 family MFS transporter
LVIGLFSFGFLEDITGSIRNSIIALIVFFVLGLFALMYTKRAVNKT